MSIRLAHVSDIHFGRLNALVAEALMAELIAEAPDVLIVSGDLTQRARVGQYEQAAAFLRRLPLPQLVIPGNHDIPLWNIFRRIATPLTRYRKYISAQLLQTWSAPGICVVAVNSARSFTRTSGWLNDKQIGQIHRVFAAAGEKDLRILVTHHPFIPAPDFPHPDVIRRAGPTLARLADCRIDLLLAGHLHRAYHGDVRAFYPDLRRSILSIQAGSACSTRLRNEPNSYNRITIDENGTLLLQVRQWSGVQFQSILDKRFNKIDGLWREA